MAKKVAYLTIDDGPTKDMPEKLEFLESHAIPAVLFCRGDYLEARPQIAIDAIKRGFVIANHSYDHPHFSNLSLEEAYDQIRRADSILESIYKQAGTPMPGRFFRFPYGDKGDMTYGIGDRPVNIDGAANKLAIQDFLRSLGYTQPTFPGVTYNYYREQGMLSDVDWLWTYDVVEWSVYSDRHLYEIDSLEKVFARMDENVPEGGRGLNDPASEEIILTHDHVESTEIFKPIIERLLSKDLIFKLPTF